MNNKLVSKGIFTLTLLTLTICSSCSKDDSGSSSTGQKETIVNNTNSNIKDIRPATHRLEFPRLKGGSSTILTHELNTGEVNYSVEWDIVKKSNRWTCYEIYAKNAEKNVPRKPYTDPNQYPFDPLFPRKCLLYLRPYLRLRLRPWTHLSLGRQEILKGIE